MKKFFLITGFFLSLNSFSQDTTLNKVVDTPSVIVHKDPRIDLLVKKQIQINEETTREARRVGKGYRLLVINTNKREEAAAAKTTLYTYFPELKSYLLYQAPYFKLKVGNFKEKKEAEDYQKRLEKYFPKGVFIMNDTIELKLDKENETVSRN
ncbi:MAG TPA: SPOR domain-containing protein [Chitinophagaceae bacterium]